MSPALQVDSLSLSHWFSSVQSIGCIWLCDPMDCSMSGFPVHHQLPELAQIHVHWVGDAIQPFHPLSSGKPIISQFSPPMMYLNLRKHAKSLQLCSTLRNTMDYSMSGFPVHHQLPNLAQTHVHRVGNAIQSSRPLSSPSPPASVTLLRPVLFRCLSSHHAYLLSLLSFLFFLWVSTQKNSNISVLKCKS